MLQETETKRGRERNGNKSHDGNESKARKEGGEWGSCKAKSIACGVPGHAAMGRVVKVTEKLQGLRVV